MAADDSDDRSRGTLLNLTAIGLTLVTIAAVVVVIIASRDSDTETQGGTELTAQQVHGRSVFNASCATCHTLAASNAVSSVGPNLDALKPPRALILDAIQNGRARGNGQMPAGLVSGPDAEAVAAYVAGVAGDEG